MATLVTKYNVGDVVWRATTTGENKKFPCPDCHGSRSWQAISPAGRGYVFACPRCNSSYVSDRALSLDNFQYVPCAHQLTIGQVGWDNYDPPGPRYMCRETGVGSGSVYRETELFDTEELALSAATLMAAEQNARRQANPDVYRKHLEVKDYQLDLAVAKAAQSELHSYKYDLGFMIEDLVDRFDADWKGAPTRAEIFALVAKHFPDAVPEEELADA